MNKPYTCHLCSEEFDALSDDEKVKLESMGITMVVVKCSGCGEVFLLDISESATFIGNATDSDKALIE